MIVATQLIAGSPSRDTESRTQSSRATIAVVPPYPGEFGWELMNWQARLRYLLVHHNIEKMFVCAPADRRMLYSDPRMVLIPTEGPHFAGHACDDRRIEEFGTVTDPTELRLTALKAAATAMSAAGLDLATLQSQRDDLFIVTPEYRGTLWPTTPTFQRFTPLSAPQSDVAAVDVVLMPRSRSSAVDRNQPTSWWNELSDTLKRRGHSVAFAPQVLPQSIEMLSRCRLAAGGSTGGLHLASLCETPHLVWGPDDQSRWTAWEITNRQRYETIWNPLGTPVVYEPLGWRPDVTVAAELICDTLRRIGRGNTKPNALARQKLAWRMRRLCMSWSLGDTAHNVPWRVRRLLTGAF